MRPTERNLHAEIKKALEKQHARTITDKEVEEVNSLLQLLAEIHVDNFFEECARQDKLKIHPKGFHLEKDGVNCCICHEATSKGSSWYDEQGVKCLTCQKAIDEGMIPASLCKDDKSYYTEIDLELSFSLKGKILRQFIKSGLLKCRLIAGTDRKIHRRLFLLSDNKNFLPPKHLVQTRAVKETRNGREEIVFAPWYWCCDNVHDHLSGYGIVEYLEMVPTECDQQTIRPTY